ncbi:MAG: dihydrodipicolinate synthase family protein [Deltaproteobacteria bacterium]|nr:dihydrodipicolinate synthase family protein [Deltaproteobacteria bacterium]MBW2394501.1 dihydrodipicolinate synthase family protein [Deltaproteobacteria bacterium]
MRTVEDTRPRPGLSVPVVTPLSEDGQLLEDDLRSVVRFVVQDGYGADVVFAAGTTGEWDRIGAATQRRVIQLCTEEVAKANAELGRPVESWAGITARTPEETLENLDAAIACGVDAAVLAPLSIRGLSDPVRFVARDVADLLDARTRRIPVYLYDNADIAVDPKVPHIRTRQVKALSRLDFVRGIKVSASKRVLGNYTKAAAGFRDRGEFGIYIGNAMLIFEIFRPRTGVLGSISEHWQRYRMRGGLPIGVVAGPANAMPREWARAWQLCRAGDAERMDRVQRIVEAFRVGTRAAGGKRTIACLKRALLSRGVISCDAVAEGTPALARPDAERFDAMFEEVRSQASELLVPTWVTPDPGAAE